MQSNKAPEPLFDLPTHLLAVRTLARGERETASLWTDVSHILSRAQASRLVLVSGVGGSFAPALLFAALLRARTGAPALAAPLHMLSAVGTRVGVGGILVSASASHPSAWEAGAAMVRAGAWLGLCSLVTKTPLQIVEDPNDPPACFRADGDEFLATRSLAALLARIYWCFDGEVGATTFTSALAASVAVNHCLPSRNQLSVVYDDWGEALAADLLMRCRETSTISASAIAWPDYIHGGYMSSSVPQTGTVFFLGTRTRAIAEAAQPQFPHLFVPCDGSAACMGAGFGFNIAAHARALVEDESAFAPNRSPFGDQLWKAAR